MAEWGLVPTDKREAADFLYPELPAHENLTGAQMLARAEKGMSVSAALANQIAKSGKLRGMSIALSLIVEPKTAVLVERLAAAGANVGVYCHAHECDQRVADELAARGHIIEANSTWTPAQEHEGALRLMDRLKPDLIIDDGANFARLLVMERPELVANVRGIAEETTSGVRAFQAMADEGELPFPIIAVNDSALKTCFDNRHGTGETCVSTTMELLGPDALSSPDVSVCVIGYGPVGEGFARRVRTLGARVAIVETDPVKALEARFAGFEVAAQSDVLHDADVVVSATGVRHTLALDALQTLREGAAVVVIGGIQNEIALDEVIQTGGSLRPEKDKRIFSLALPNGRRLRLLAAGDGVNYAAGPGNPIQIMDLSFAVQLCAVDRIVSGDKLPVGVHRLGPDTDRRIASLALAARGISIDVEQQEKPLVPDWRVTHYSDAITQE